MTLPVALNGVRNEEVQRAALDEAGADRFECTGTGRFGALEMDMDWISFRMLLVQERKRINFIRLCTYYLVLQLEIIQSETDGRRNKKTMAPSLAARFIARSSQTPSVL